MSESSLALQRALAGVARRLRWRRALVSGALGLACILSVAIVMVVTGAILAPTSLAAWPRIVGWFLMAAIVAVWIAGLTRPVSDAEAAGQADASADLRDELKSSLWFSRSSDPSAWVRAHVDRAAATASSLEPREVVRLGMPPAGWAAMGLAAVLAAVAGLSPRFTPHFGEHSGDVAAPAARTPAERGDMEALVAQMERTGDAVAKSRLEQALTALDDPGRSAAEKRRALEAARQIAAQRALEAAASAERMRALADSLASRKGMEDVADALRQGDARAAAEALRSRLERSADGADTTGDPQGVARAPADDQAIADQLKESLQPGADEKPSGEAAGATEGRLAKAVQNLEEIARRIEASAALNQAARKLNAASAALNRESNNNLRAARFGRQQGSANASESPDTGEADIRGGHMFRLGAVAQERKQSPTQERARAGDASGNAKGDPVVGDEVSRIEAKLKRESVKGREAEGPDGQDSAFYAASRQGEVHAEYQEVEARYRQTGEEVLGVERIALRDRARVKQFFSDSTETAK